VSVHLFTYKDVRRIVRQVEPVGPEEIEDVIGTVRAAHLDLLRALTSASIVWRHIDSLLDLIEETAELVSKVMMLGPRTVSGLILNVFSEIFGWGGESEIEIKESSTEGGA